MTDFAIIWEWLSFAVRWLHVITAMAWIGSSFYFIALDLGLRQSPDLPKGAYGEEWQVHGGGFYHINKYLVAPARLPDHLIWFKWESYSTWLSGAALLMILYWAGAELYLIDPAKADLTMVQAILISGGSLALGWAIYDLLCRSRLGDHPTLLMLLLFVLIVAAAWGYDQVFTGRAALLHLGAFTATVMTANVFMIIIPNQKIVVADLRAGRHPDAKYGRIAKLRSTHNNYLTLPVIFLMLANHYPLSFASEYNWLIASLVFLMGVTIRHYFNTRHAGKGSPHWTWAVSAVIFIVIMYLSSLGITSRSDDRAPSESSTSQLRPFVNHPQFEEIHQLVAVRCAGCHAAEPLWENVHIAPKGVILESPADVAKNARQIYVHAGLTQSMPPANIAFMETEERQQIVRWYQESISGK